MKKTLSLIAIIIFLGIGAVSAMAKTQCTTIQSGTLLGSDGSTLVLGYDKWGYNYQAHMFSGWYDNYSRPSTPVTGGDRLIMKWNDAWLSNKDCDGDGKLDRHFGYDSYKGSGAWLTNHQSGTYEGENGETCKWEYFVKIVAAPKDAYTEGGIWYTADGEEIGPVIWGEFATIQEVYNDSCAGSHGIYSLSPVGPGLGKW